MTPGPIGRARLRKKQLLGRFPGEALAPAHAGAVVILGPLAELFGSSVAQACMASQNGDSNRYLGA